MSSLPPTPIKILFLATNPTDTPLLNLGEESNLIDKAIRIAKYRDYFQVEHLWAVKVSDLQEILLRHKPHIVHFSGHGNTSNEIILQDSDGLSTTVPLDALAKLFSILKDNVQCVVLNACFSKTQADEIAKYVDFVIGISSAIEDNSAAKFSFAFYQAIAYGRDIKTAFDLGREQLELERKADGDIQLIAPRREPSEIVLTNLFITNTYVATAAKQISAEKKRVKRQKLPKPKIVGQFPSGAVDNFKDRELVQKNITGFFSEPTVRLVNIHGTVGIGKTFVACKTLLDLSSDNQLFDGNALKGIMCLSTRTTGISTENISHFSKVMLDKRTSARLDSILANPQSNLQKKIAFLLELFKDGIYIVFLDMLDDLLDGSGQIIDEGLDMLINHLLQAPTCNMRLLVTSRIPLVIKVEMRRLIRSVDLVEGLPVEDSIAYLREIDQAGDLGLRDAPRDNLMKLVSLVHGIPMGLEKIAQILDESPDYSVEDVIRVFFHHQDIIQSLIETRYAHLKNESRKVIEALAVFGRPVNIDAISYLLAPFVSTSNLPDVIKDLARTKTVKIDRNEKLISILPVDQDFAYNRLVASSIETGEYSRELLEYRAGQYYLDMSKSHSDWENAEDLIPILRSAEHFEKSGQPDLALGLLLESDPNMQLWGVRQPVKLRERLHNLVSIPEYKMSNCINLGNWFFNIGQVTKAQSYYQEALLLSDEVGNQDIKGVALGNLGSLFYALGQISQAISYSNQALEIAHITENLDIQPIWLNILGLSYALLGQMNEASDLYYQAMNLAKQLSDKETEAACLNNLGNAYVELGESKLAQQMYEQALVIQREIVDKVGIGTTLHSIAELLIDIGQYTEAMKRARSGLEIGKDLENPNITSDNLCALARVALYKSRLEDAESYAELAVENSSHQTKHYSLLLHAIVALELGDTERARVRFTLALNEASDLLVQTADHYNALRTKQLSLCGLTVCSQDESTTFAREASKCIQNKQIYPGGLERFLFLFSLILKRDSKHLLDETPLSPSVIQNHALRQ